MITIRKAELKDASTLLHFITKIAEYEKLAHEVENTVEKIEQRFFSEHPIVFALIVENEQKEAIGYAIYFFNYSTFTGDHGLYLEDFYIDEEYRHQGIGKQVFNELIAIAKQKQCSRMEWIVLDWNTPAIQFYESYDARPLNEWIQYRLVREQF